MGDRMYRIGQAARLLGLKPHVLRFWETEFPQLAPVRTEKGQRLYTAEHMALLKTIHRLVHGEGLTLEGARRRLEQEEGLSDLKRSVAEELRSIRRLLDPDQPGEPDRADEPGRTEQSGAAGVPGAAGRVLSDAPAEPGEADTLGVPAAPGEGQSGAPDESREQAKPDEPGSRG